MTAIRLLAGGSLAALLMLPTPPVSAADLSSGVRKAVATDRHQAVRGRRAARVVRDYDGTPVVFRPYRRVVVTGADGLPSTKTEYAADPVLGATPRSYSNGEPVLPFHPRGWPRTATLRYRMMHGLP